jgi:DNA-binding Lrp family transcriptional regulator
LVESKKRKVKNKLHRFYFLSPKENANIDELTDRIISLKNVEEVFVTDGDYGYIVKTRFSNGRDSKAAEQYLKKTVNRKFGVVTSYFQYKKK